MGTDDFVRGELSRSSDLQVKIMVGDKSLDPINMECSSLGNCFFNHTYESNLIKKDSHVGIKVYKESQLLIESNQPIEYYLTNWLLRAASFNNFGLERVLEMSAYWEDEYKPNIIADAFLDEPYRQWRTVLMPAEITWLALCRQGAWKPQVTQAPDIRKKCDNLEKLDKEIKEHNAKKAPPKVGRR